MSATEFVSSGTTMPRLARVEPVGDLSLSVIWASGRRTGRTETVDLAPLIGQFRFYAPLRHNRELFDTAHVVEEGGAVEWGDGEIDMAATSIERLAEEQMTTEDFVSFMERNKLTRRAAASALGRSLRMIQNYIEGYPIPRVVALACIGYESRQAASKRSDEAA